jgi:hypothetical protein
MKTKLIPSLALIATMMVAGPAVFAGRCSHPSVAGTWYLALDTTPFGIQGLALSGLATFHDDGTVLIIDAGDFGQATFLNKQHSVQMGAWRCIRGRDIPRNVRKVVASTLFLEADLDGEVEAWYRVELELTMSGDGQELKGFVTTLKLPCDVAPPIPTPLTCPDPIENADLFEIDGPPNVPVTLRRLSVES